MTNQDTETPAKLSDAEFYARGLARSRFHDRLFAENRPRPTNEQFDEGWAAAKAFYTAAQPADLISREAAVQACLNEFVDAKSSQEESDFAYNRACEDCADTIRALPAIQSPTAVIEAAAREIDRRIAAIAPPERPTKIAAIITRHLTGGDDDTSTNRKHA